MALYQDLPVFADIYLLTHKVFLYTQDYPREYKFTLGQDMKRDCLVLLRSIYQINTKNGAKPAGKILEIGRGGCYFSTIENHLNFSRFFPQMTRERSSD